MEVPLEIHFHNLAVSPALEQTIRAHAAKLERFARDVISCRVTVEAPHRRRRQGKLFAVRVDLRFAGGEAVASRDPSARHQHEDAYVAARDAFKAVRRQLQDRVRMRRGEVKPHEAPPHGKVKALDPDRRCGRIETPDGREIYFHGNSVLNVPFERLEPGAEVRFSEEAGDEGPQASTVRVIGKHHIVGREH
jgi:ribosomal subunit interface protein